MLNSVTRPLTGALLLLVICSGSSWAVPEIEINGLIIDQTRTRVGQEIYRQFSSRWGEVHVNFPFNITIWEIPDARWGSIVALEVNGHTAYRSILQPRTDKIDKEVEKALREVRNYLIYLVRANGTRQSMDLLGSGY